jgi:hypothetical protein
MSAKELLRYQLLRKNVVEAPAEPGSGEVVADETKLTGEQAADNQPAGPGK